MQAGFINNLRKIYEAGEARALLISATGTGKTYASAFAARELELRKEHLQDLIDLAWGIKEIGVKEMSFEAFDTRKIDEYAAQAKASWGTTAAYKEYEQKAKGRSWETQKKLNVEMMNIFAEFGRIKELPADSDKAAALAKKLQEHITENYYTCTDEILLSLGTMYAGGGDFTTNIDKIGGEGTAAFACEAIKAMVAAK